MCRAFLSPWYERGGFEPADENDTPIFIGRFNMGAISLNLPLIYAKSVEDDMDFFEVLDSYLEKIREIHLRTIEYLGNLRASINPLAFCEGGFYGGHLKHTDKIKPLLESATASFGYTALNELQELYNHKSLVEDGEFAVKVLQHINDKVNEFKKEDHVLYAIYGAPAESLCFSGDTEVQTYKGYIPIKDIKVGDLVYTYNEKKKKIELKEVLAAFMTSPAAKVVKVKTTNGQVFTCTSNHPFAVRKMKMKPGGKFEKEYIEYIPAAELKPGMRLKSNYMQIHNVDELPENHVVESVEFPEEEIPVYNITVEDNHNYFVGGADGVLVHNCGLQIKQFRKKYGVIEGVSDREYVSNSFHCHVSEDITGIQKQNLENRFWNLSNGGKIQYVRYPIDYNFDACKAYVTRAMQLGFYEGINLSLAYCDDCGHSELGMDKCSKCGSTNLTKIDRMNGYLSYSRVKGDTRLNDAKMAEIADRKSM